MFLAQTATETETEANAEVHFKKAGEHKLCVVQIYCTCIQENISVNV